MKTKPTKIDRSGAKWLPGAMALAATASSTQAATVQITLTGNKISSIGGNQLNADVTGDGVGDIAFGNNNVFFSNNRAKALFFDNGISKLIVAAYNSSYGGFYSAQRLYFGYPKGLSSGGGYGPESQNAVFLDQITFSDPNIRGGALTNAWLEVRAFNESKTSHTVELTRVFYDDATGSLPQFASLNDVPGWQVAAVPEPSGFLATSLLLGAAGLIRRRQAKAA